MASSEPLCFGPPPRSDPSRTCEEGLSVEVDEPGTEEVELELDDEDCVGVVDVVVSLEEELIRVGEAVWEVADADEEDVDTGVAVDVSDEVVVVPLELLGCLLRALCKTSPRSRASTALSTESLTLSCVDDRFSLALMLAHILSIGSSPLRNRQAMCSDAIQRRR